ncbi:hypothetical protein F5Y18DRAFT_433114 [Xylariaceae sp. FL1019]|nr:hypothetical protein F5Y18DRAFT_433114 [Xylariaceae sp. FL1019]
MPQLSGVSCYLHPAHFKLHAHSISGYYLHLHVAYLEAVVLPGQLDARVSSDLAGLVQLLNDRLEEMMVVLMTLVYRESLVYLKYSRGLPFASCCVLPTSTLVTWDGEIPLFPHQVYLVFIYLPVMLKKASTKAAAELRTPRALAPTVMIRGGAGIDQNQNIAPQNPGTGNPMLHTSRHYDQFPNTCFEWYDQLESNPHVPFSSHAYM